jgi:hypothetical protein
MDAFHFYTPLLGKGHIMFADIFRFRIDSNKHLSFYSHHRNEPFRCSLFARQSHHKKVICYLECVKTPPVRLEKISKRKHMLTADKNINNIRFIVAMIREVFSLQEVPVEVCVGADDNYMGRCDFHLLDLYEMGYMTHAPVVLHHPSVFSRYNPSAYTGIFLHANNPLHRHPEDYMELELSCHSQNNFLLISLENLLLDRPEFAVRINPIIASLLQSIPLHTNKPLRKLMEEWELYFWVEVRPYNLSIPIADWKPGVFLQHFTRLLDIFHSYTLTKKFSIDFKMA